MANSVYRINKGINRSIEFKGLKAQYIWYLGGGVIVLLILFAIMYILGLPTLICIGITVAAGSFLVVKVYGMSRQYGEHGMMKALARKGIPGVVKRKGRSVFYGLKAKEL